MSMVSWLFTFSDGDTVWCPGRDILDAVSHLLHNSGHRVHGIVKIERGELTSE